MPKMILAITVAAGFATPALAASGIAPDPATWAMLLAGFGFVGFAARGRATGINRVSA
jgi:hypothetical protein